MVRFERLVGLRSVRTVNIPSNTDHIIDKYFEIFLDVVSVLLRRTAFGRNLGESTENVNIFESRTLTPSFFACSPLTSRYSLPITRNWKTGVCNYSNYSCNYNTAVITATETRHGKADAY